MSEDLIQKITDRLLRQLPPHRRVHLAKSAATPEDILSKAIDAWAANLNGELRFLKAESDAIKKKCEEVVAQQADLSRRLAAEERRSIGTPALPSPTPISKEHDIGGTDMIRKKT